MRVAFLTNQYPKVSHTFIRREINGLEAAGVHVERYSVRRTSDHLVDEADRRENECTRAILSSGIAGLVPAFLWTGIRHPFRLLRTLVRAWRMGWGSDRGPLVHLVYVAEACVLMAWAKKDRIEHVHVHFGTNPTAVALLAHWLGGPSYSFVVHGPEEFDKPESLGMEAKIKEAKFVVAISSYGRSQLFRWCDESQWPKIKVIRMGVDGDFLDDPPQLPMPDGGKLVCVGRLCPQKGQVLLVDAFAKVLALGHDAELVLVGDGESRPQVERRIHECGIEQQVRITGWAGADTVRNEILAARALVLPSFSEGLPDVRIAR